MTANCRLTKKQQQEAWERYLLDTRCDSEADEAEWQAREALRYVKSKNQNQEKNDGS
jgi:hypothetical protein